MKTVLFGEKKWWAVLLGGVFNSVAYAAVFTEFCLGSMAAAMCLSAIPFALMLIVVNTVRLKKLFISTAIYAGTLILIGFPLSRAFFTYRYETLFPGNVIEDLTGGDGFAMLIATGFYLFMSLLAWFIVIVKIGVRAAQPEKGGAYGHP